MHFICDGARVGCPFLTCLHLKKALLGLAQVWAPGSISKEKRNKSKIKQMVPN